jgi:hypothetical protein
MKASRLPILIVRGTLLFWALYFAIVCTTNLTDALKALGILDARFVFASDNYQLIRRVTGIYELPELLNVLLFAGVVLWEGVAAAVFFHAFFKAAADYGGEATLLAFGVSLALWMTFILMDEFFIAYHVAGLETTHIGLLAAQLASLILIRLLSRDRQGIG